MRTLLFISLSAQSRVTVGIDSLAVTVFAKSCYVSPSKTDLTAPEANMFVLARAVTYAALFISVDSGGRFPVNAFVNQDLT